jgi:hypothetical protein
MYGTSGNTAVNVSNPWLTIKGALNIASGAPVDKIGARSGWTRGYITGTCEDIHMLLETGIHPISRDFVRCVGRASYYANGGDSGGPVFYYDGIDGVSLVGVHSSCEGDDVPCTNALFSTFANIQSELGTLNVATNITVSPPVISGTLIGGTVPSLSWTTSSVTGSTAPTVYYITRSTWDGSTFTWLESEKPLGTTTGTTFVDYTLPVIVSTYMGATEPNRCFYTSVMYTLFAYNTGVGASAMPVYLRGSHNGNTSEEFC